VQQICSRNGYRYNLGLTWLAGSPRYIQAFFPVPSYYKISTKPSLQMTGLETL
jgi:hypothetical protein